MKERESERTRKSREQERAESKMEREGVSGEKSFTKEMCSLFPPIGLIEAIMVLLRNKSLWDTVHGQGSSGRSPG